LYDESDTEEAAQIRKEDRFQVTGVDIELKHTIIMRDNDGKFHNGFDEVLEVG
tara:strand:+ start:309 stop:467 length:159 start_codon:yes stop_codon:yes gene_type:complete